MSDWQVSLRKGDNLAVLAYPEALFNLSLVDIFTHVHALSRGSVSVGHVSIYSQLSEVLRGESVHKNLTDRDTG